MEPDGTCRPSQYFLVQNMVLYQDRFKTWLGIGLRVKGGVISCARNNGTIFAILIAIRTAGSQNSYLYEKIGIFGNSPKVPHTQIVKVEVGVI